MTQQIEYNLILKDFHPVLSMSEETIAFTSNIYVEDTKVGFASNRGQNTPIYVRWLDENAEDQFKHYLETLKPDVDQNTTNLGHGRSTHILTMRV